MLGEVWGGIVVRVWSRGMALARVLSGEEAALRVKQFVLYCSTRNKRQAEVVDLHLFIINKWLKWLKSPHAALLWGFQVLRWYSHNERWQTVAS